MTITAVVDLILERLESYSRSGHTAIERGDGDVALYSAGYRAALHDVLEAMMGDDGTDARNPVHYRTERERAADWAGANPLAAAQYRATEAGREALEGERSARWPDFENDLGSWKAKP